MSIFLGSLRRALDDEIKKEAEIENEKRHKKSLEQAEEGGMNDAESVRPDHVDDQTIAYHATHFIRIKECVNATPEIIGNVATNFLLGASDSDTSYLPSGIEGLKAEIEQYYRDRPLSDSCIFKNGVKIRSIADVMGYIFNTENSNMVIRAMMLDRPVSDVDPQFMVFLINNFLDFVRDSYKKLGLMDIQSMAWGNGTCAEHMPECMLKTGGQYDWCVEKLGLCDSLDYIEDAL